MMALLEDRAEVDHGVDVLARRRVFDHRRLRSRREKITERPDTGSTCAGIAGASKRKDPEAAIGLHDVAEMNGFRVGDANDRRGVKARADRQALGEALPARFSG